MPGVKKRAPDGDQAGGSGPPPADEAVRLAVLAALGRPPGLFRVAVLPLWGGRFRVNVLVGDDASSVRVAHSYFVDAGDDGAIVSSTPRLTRLYG